MKAVKLANVTLPETVTCAICDHKAHILVPHLKEEHDLSAVEYAEKHPGSPIVSAVGAALIGNRVSPTATLLVKPDREYEEVTISDVFPCWKDEKAIVKRFIGPAPFVPAGSDENYVYDYEATMGLLLALVRNKRNSCWISGYSGTGKTQLVLNVARRLNMEVIRVNLDVNMVPEHLLGGWSVRDKSTFFNYGPVALAMKRGAILLLDEFDHVNPYVAPIFRPLLEESPRLMIAENGGEIVEPDEDFRIIATANTFGAGDSTGLYGTSQQLNLADRQRFSVFLEMDYLEASQETEMLTSAVEDLDKEDAEAILHVANAVRSRFKAGELEESLSPRQIINWAELYLETGNILKAAKMAFLRPLSLSSQGAITQLIEAEGFKVKGG